MFFAIPTLLLQTRTRHDLKFDGTLLNLDLILKQNILNEKSGFDLGFTWLHDVLCAS